MVVVVAVAVKVVDRYDHSGGSGSSSENSGG